MHLRRKRFEYSLIRKKVNGDGKPDHEIEPLLRVNYHFRWQMSYRLAEPRLLGAGAELQAVGWYDNSKGNPHNPDAEAEVRWGKQTYDEMTVGFFDVAVPAGVDQQRFFIRTKEQQQVCSRDLHQGTGEARLGRVRCAICNLTTRDSAIHPRGNCCAKLGSWSFRSTINRDHTSAYRSEIPSAPPEGAAR